MDTDEQRLQTIGDYKHGSIKRVKMHQFLTYKDVEVFPGPRLNMVIGPNGTGKSTILCAICLALGGDPRDLGRASDIESFVMNHQEIHDGSIEVELVNEHGDNPVIVRKIKKSGSPKSQFFLNGEAISQKKIKAMVLEEFSIDVANLCTFLPQDKVGGFSGFNAQDLLRETQKSLSSNHHLWTTHQELIQAQEELANGHVTLASLEEKVKQLQTEISRFEREKQRMEEREIALEQVDLLKKKLLWLKFDEGREETMEAKTEAKELKKKAREFQQQLEPLVEEHDRILAQQKNYDKRYKELSDQTKKLQKEMEKQQSKYETHDDKIEGTFADLQAIDVKRSNLEAKVEEQRQRVQNFEQQMKDLPSIEVVNEDINAASKELKEIRPMYLDAKNELDKVKNQFTEASDEEKHCQRRWHKLQDEASQRKQRFFRMEPNVKHVHTFIQNNRNQFRKEVIGPIACEVSMKSNNAAAYLEQHVPNSTLKAFVVQCKEDYDFLYREVRQNMRLPINIIKVEGITNNIRRPYSDRTFKILQKEHGVASYLDESFDAPQEVVQALMDSANIHKVLVGGDKTQASIDDKALLQFLTSPEGGRKQDSCIFASKGTQSMKYTTNISKKSGNEFTRIDNIKAPKYLGVSTSEDAKRETMEKLQSAQQSLEALRPAVEAAQEEVARHESGVQDAQRRLKDAKDNKNNLTKHESRLKNAQRKLKEAEAELATDDEEEKEKLISALKNRVSHSITALEAHAECHRQLMQATYKSAGARINKDKLVSDERRARHAKLEAQDNFKTAESQYKRANEKFAKLRSALEKLKEQADEEAPLCDEEGNELPLKAQLEELGVANTQEAEVALEEAEEKANSIIANPNVVRQYEEKKEEMELAQGQLDDLKEGKDAKEAQLNNKRKPWEDALTNSITKVDKLFSKYMAEFGFTGEVGLRKGPESGDTDGPFKDWGVEIKVSFRQGVKPQVLSAKVQSGGERSVSTILYLMALQEMMVSPFRCVDEINQGLDERNERLVFRRIVENSTLTPGSQGPTDHCGQYFLITPKLLPNLYDMEDEAMTVLFVLNGPFNFKHPTDWNIDNLVNCRKRPAISPSDDQENGTPNSEAAEVARTVPRKKARKGRPSAAKEQEMEA